MMTITTKLGGILAALLLAACATPTPLQPAKTHLAAADVPVARGTIPPPVQQSLALAKPKPAAKTETYSVVVNNVKVQELLFALARDAKLNVDVHPGIDGTVTMNAIDQTLPQLLSRIAKQADVRWELDGPNLAVMPDTPFLRNYKIDYVNMNRDTSGSVSVTTQITSSVPGGGAASGGTGAGNNNSSTRIENTAKNRFWETLVQNIKDLLRETDKILPEGSSETVTEQLNQQQTTGTGTPPPPARRGRGTSPPQPNIAGSPNPASFQDTEATIVRRSTFREAASVIANAETGIVSIRATSRQHEKIQEFVDQVMSSAKRQVLIEATVAEVQLDQSFQQGIDWSRIRLDRVGLRLIQTGATVTGVGALGLGGAFELGYDSPNNNFASTIKLLETFGTVKILSSPKISVLNNQSAVLKVVDNQVYFSVKVETNQNANTSTTNVTTTAYSVPVGFVMNVTPQISENDTVLLNLRPSISRVVTTVADPNPQLTTPNLIPIIRTREMESVIRIENGNIAVMGGLMEDSVTNSDRGLPGVSRTPILGALFSQRNDASTKTELVVFLRPVIVREASVAGDYREFRDLLPNKEFFGNNPGPQYQLAPSDSGSRP